MSKSIHISLAKFILTNIFLSGATQKPKCVSILSVSTFRGQLHSLPGVVAGRKLYGYEYGKSVNVLQDIEKLANEGLSPSTMPSPNAPVCSVARSTLLANIEKLANEA